MSRAAVFVALAGVLAASLAVLAGLVAAQRGLEVNLWLTIATAVVVGLFVSFLWLGPRDPEGPEGFEVVGRRRTGSVQAQQDDQGPPEAGPTQGEHREDP